MIVPDVDLVIEELRFSLQPYSYENLVTMRVLVKKERMTIFCSVTRGFTQRKPNFFRQAFVGRFDIIRLLCRMVGALWNTKI